MRFSKTTAYKLVAILNVAATGHQDGVPTCSQWFLKISNFKKCILHDSCIIWPFCTCVEHANHSMIIIIYYETHTVVQIVHTQMYTPGTRFAKYLTTIL